MDQDIALGQLDGGIMSIADANESGPTGRARDRRQGRHGCFEPQPEDGLCPVQYFEDDGSGIEEKEITRGGRERSR